MQVKLSKTWTQNLQELPKIGAATDVEVANTMAKYKYVCEFAKAGCSQRFKTKAGMKIHWSSFNFNYGLTEERWEVECIIAVFGNASRKLYLVQWMD